MNKQEAINKCIKSIQPVGSRVTCSPAPTDTDQDYLVLTNSEEDFYKLTKELLYSEGYTLCGDAEYITPIEQEEDTRYYGFQSFRKGDVNYIITNCQTFFDEFMKATAIAKKYNLMKKHERVGLFQWLLYDTFGCYEEYLDENFPLTKDHPASEEEMIQAIKAVVYAM